MNQEKRRMMAYVIGRLVLKKQATAVYDHAAKAWFQAAGDCALGKIAVFDHQRQCYLIGVTREGRTAVFDHGTQQYIEIKLKGNKFEGFDFESKFHFGGIVEKERIALYDFEKKKYYQYALPQEEAPVAPQRPAAGETRRPKSWKG